MTAADDMPAPPAPPIRLVDLDKARAAYGAAADRLPALLAVGDPPADAVIAELGDLGAEGRRLLEQGLGEGLASLDGAPPAIGALLRQLEERPAWTVDSDLADGDRATQAIPPPWDVVAFAAVSMTHVYASPAIARLLVGTGQLTAGASAPRRLAETGLWRSHAVLPGGLERGAPGYVATARVRLMHARVRAMALRDGWDVPRWGVPINQADLARTWLAFTILPFRCLSEVVGIELGEAEERHLYRYWRHIGRLLGLDDTLIAPVRGHAEAAELLDLLDMTTGEPDADSRALTEALFAVTSHALAQNPEPALSASAWRDVFGALARASLGDRLADGLGIPVSPAGDYLPLIALGQKAARRIQLANPEEAEKARLRHIAIRVQRITPAAGPGTAAQAAPESASGPSASSGSGSDPSSGSGPSSSSSSSRS